MHCQQHSLVLPIFGPRMTGTMLQGFLCFASLAWHHGWRCLCTAAPSPTPLTPAAVSSSSPPFLFSGPLYVAENCTGPKKAFVYVGYIRTYRIRN